MPGTPLRQFFVAHQVTAQIARSPGDSPDPFPGALGGEVPAQATSPARFRERGEGDVSRHGTNENRFPTDLCCVLVTLNRQIQIKPEFKFDFTRPKGQRTRLADGGKGS